MSEADNIVNSILGQYASAEGNAAINIEVNPDQAAEAIELGRDMGVPAPAVLTDFNGFKASHKRRLAQEIIRTNPAMVEYLNSNPMASAVSNDDYGQLDIVSETLRKLGDKDVFGLITDGYRRFKRVERAIAAGAIEGYGWESQKQEFNRLVNYIDHPLWQAFVVQSGFGGAVVTFDSFMRAFNGLFVGLAAGAGEIATQITGSETSGNRLTRDVYALLQVGTTGIPSAAQAGVFVTPRMVSDSAMMIRNYRPWIESGRTLPTGLDPVIDQVKAQQAKVSVDNLLEATDEAARSTTQKRNPELFADFIQKHTNASIGVSSEAVLRLYGDKRPTPDDGLFGWVPGIEQQMAVAGAYGGDIVVPLSDWLARVDPAVARSLRDDIRVRPGEPTAVEARLAAEELKGISEDQTSAGAVRKREPGETRPQVSDEEFLADLNRRIEESRKVEPLEPIEAVRKSAGLEPLFALGDRKLTLRPLDKFTYDAKDPGGPRTVNTFDLYDSQGRNVGLADITEQDGGKTLYVENIAADWRLGPSPNRFGPRVMIDLLEQIKEAFPNAERIGGFRVSGAREKAGVKTDGVVGAETWIKLDEAGLEELRKSPQGWEFAEPGPRPELAPEGLWLPLGDSSIEAYVKPAKALIEKEAALVQAVTEALDRIVPHKVGIQEAQRLRRLRPGEQSSEPLGAYVQFEDAWPVIAWTFEDTAALGTIRHEAIHHLRQYNFFTLEEWNILRKAALAEGWLEKYDINNRYKGLSVEAKIEEAIADGFKHWWLEGAKVPDEIKPMFERLKEFLTEIKERVKAILGKEELTWEDIFAKVEAGEIGSRPGGPPRNRRAFAESVPEEPKKLDAFAKAQAIGMTKQQYDAYMKLIDKRQLEDFERALKRAQAEQKRKQSEQWKAWEIEERPQAVEDVNARPYVQADKYFREGQLFGQELPSKPRLGVEYLTEDQQNILPKSWQSKTGLHPDDVAPIFGYSSGKEMLAQLEWFVNERNASKRRPEEYQRLLIDEEVQRRVEAKHGKLEENILDEAIDQALSKTQLQLLHEETLALASKAGLQFSIDPVAFEKSIKDAFAEQPLASVNSERIMAAVTKHGKTAELALLQGKPAEAFRAKQQQFLAVVALREARQLEKDRAAVEQLAKRYANRGVKGVEHEYTDFIQQLLSQAGYKLRVTPDEIASNIEFRGYENLDTFVQSKLADGWEPAVSESLRAAGAKPLDKMTVADFREFKDAIESLNYIGREVNKIEIAGQKQDMAEFRQSVLENLRQLPVRPKDHYNWFYRFDASLTKPEEILKDLDLRKEAGPLWEAVFVPLVKSKAKEFDMLTELSQHFKETKGAFSKKWRKSLDETIPQDFLYDPYLSEPGSPVKMDLTREMLINIMLNWGNKSNRSKLAGGFAMVENGGRRPTKDEIASMEARIGALIDQHALKEDWDFVQRMVEPFKRWRPQIEQVARNVSGVAPKMVDVSEPVMTRYGQFEGWYWPVKYDRYGSGMEVIKERQANTEKAFGPQYLRAATAQSYLKERTGYIDMVDITTSIEQAAGTMQQTIHDIAFRDSILQAGKVLYDKQLRRAIIKHYGREYTEQFDPWLKRIANQYTVMERDGLSAVRDFMHRARINLIGHALPTNLKVILSPDIGVPNPAAWLRFEANRAQNVKFAMERSNEIRHLVYNMDRDFREQLERTIARGGWDGYRAKAVEWGFWPIMKASQEFRMATFVDQYHKARARGLDDVKAAEVADSYVRERHGAASAVDLPAILNSNEFMKSLTMFYGYFNTMYNWQRQIPGNIRRGEWKNAFVSAAGTIGVGAFFGALLFNQAKENDSWWEIIGKALLIQPLSTVPGLREGSALFFEGYPARTPTESAMNAMKTLYTDLMRKQQGKPMKNPVKNTANVVGMLTGFPLGQAGRTGEFLYDLYTGQQAPPRNVFEWFRGIVHGEARLKK